MHVDIGNLAEAEAFRLDRCNSPAGQAVIAQQSAKPRRCRLKRMNASSDKYGSCEVCGEHCSDVYMLIETRPYRDLFGHKECLQQNHGGQHD